MLRKGGIGEGVADRPADEGRRRSGPIHSPPSRTLLLPARILFVTHGRIAALSCPYHQNRPYPIARPETLQSRAQRTPSRWLPR